MNSYTRQAKLNAETKPFKVQWVNGFDSKIIYGFDTEGEARVAAETLRRNTSSNNTEFYVLEDIMMTKQLGLW